MKRIVLTTSSSGLDKYNVEHSDVKQIRLHIHVENVDFVDGKNINRERFIYLINSVSESAVKTTPASEEEVRTILNEAHSQGVEEIFIVTLSSKLSESFNIISKVSEEFERKMKIVIFDSRDLNGCEAILALEAEDLLNQNMTMEEVYLELNYLRNRHHMLFAVNDISQLIRNKKLSPTSGFFANLFNIKPVLHITDDGEIKPLAKIRNFDKAKDFLVDELNNNIKIDLNTDYVYVLDAGDKAVTQKFVAYIKQNLGLKSVPVLPASSISIAHHGTNIAAICVFKGFKPKFLDHLVS